MITSKFEWQLNQQDADSVFLKEAKKEGIDELAARLLYARNIQEKEAMRNFLYPNLEHLHDPFLLYDMEKAVHRIRLAIERNELILVYGDYDADGMTAASLMKEALEEVGAECLVYLPNRFTDGYGPNQSVYQYFIEKEQVSLILTVDNGVAGHEAIHFAQERGVDVIVTDHHSLPETLPDAYVIIHPEHPKGSYPFKHLAGCGVAFKLACALLEEIQLEWLDLVAIGTIADMVSLTGENRILVQYGLSLLRQNQRSGLQELLRLAGVNPSTLTEETVGFQLAPRLNALGRLDDPAPAIELLTGFDEEEQVTIAQMVDEKNEERKELVQSIYEEAKAMIREGSSVQVLAKEGWNPGVVGIVAGRLLEELHQPVVVLSIQEGLAKGSARSVEAINIFDALDAHRDLFIAFGGHSGAAGMTLNLEYLEDLFQILNDYASAHKENLSQKSPLRLDGDLDVEKINLQLVKALDALSPFGMDNPQPTFLVKDFQVVSARTMGKDSRHLKIRIKKGETSVDVVAFNKGNWALEIAQVKGLELAVQLSTNQWNGTTTVQLNLVDARVTGVQLFDIRAKHIPIPDGVAVLNKETKEEVVVLNEVPETMAELRAWFDGKKFAAIYFKNQLKTDYYLTGFGTREQYARLYKTIYQFPEFDIRYKLKELANYLRIPRKLVVKMIQIFEELAFVTIADGVMKVNQQAEKCLISESQIYQQLVQTVKYQELLALGTPQEIYEQVTGQSDTQNKEVQIPSED